MRMQVPSFASMLSAARAGRRAEEEPKDPKEVTDDARRAEDAPADKPEDKPEGQRAEDAPADKPEDKPDGKKADDQVDCPDCGGEGEDEDGDACDTCDGTGKVAKKGKKAAARRAEEDDDGMKKGRHAERRRWGAVMAVAIPAGKATAAAAMLHDTPMPAAKIIDTLAALPAEGRGKGIHERMAGVQTPVISSDPSSGGSAAPASPKEEGAALAAKMLEATNKALGRKPAA